MTSPLIAMLPEGHRMDRQLGIVFDAIPPHPDDLTQINNIQSREQLLLNQNGVFFLSQIALWHSREMNAFAPILDITLARIIDENWVAQARELCAQRKAVVESYPSTFFRMLTVVVCALMAGVLVVWAIGTHYNKPLTGILSADITTVQAPTTARLAEVHVRAGDEVFTGQPLLQLENTEISTKIAGIMQQLQSTEQELLRLEAQAAIELEWRRRDVDSDIARLRIAVADLPQPANSRTSAARNRRVTATPASASLPVEMPAAAAALLQARRNSASQILFFDGRKPTAALTEPNHATPPVTTPAVNTPAVNAPAVNAAPAAPAAPAASPAATAQPPVQTVATAAVATTEDLSQAAEPPESTSVASGTHTHAALTEAEAEITRLQAVRTELPARVDAATGVTAARARRDSLLAELQSLKTTSPDIKVQSPVYGIIGQVRGRQGQQVAASEVMLKILHTDRRCVLVQLPTPRVHELSMGEEVELKFPGNQTYRGKVVELPLMADEPADRSETTTMVRIDPVGRLWPAVPIGCQIEVMSVR